jgi:hypothetical protein
LIVTAIFEYSACIVLPVHDVGCHLVCDLKQTTNIAVVAGAIQDRLVKARVHIRGEVTRDVPIEPDRRVFYELDRDGPLICDGRYGRTCRRVSHVS